MSRQTPSTGNSAAANSGGARRRQADFIKLATSGKYRVTATENVGDFYVLFQGSKDTPYEGGFWQVHVLLPEQYPYKSPSIGFGNPIFHPNVEERSGSVCLDVINQTWTPMYDLVNVFDVFLPQLLRYPNSSDPLNPSAATMQLESISKYTQYVQDHISRNATYARAMSVVAHLLDEDEDGDATPPSENPTDATPAKQVAGVHEVGDDQSTSPNGISPATSRGLTDSPPSSLDQEEIGGQAHAVEEEEDEEPEEIEL